MLEWPPSFDPAEYGFGGTPENRREAERLYPDETVRAIAATLPQFASAQAEALFPGNLRDWAAAYLDWRAHVAARRSKRKEGSAGRHDPKSDLLRVQRSAKALTEAYSNLSGDSLALLAGEAGRRLENVGPLSAPILGVRALNAMASQSKTLGDLAGEAVRKAGPPKKGRPLAPDRWLAVGALAVVYLEATGREATRRVNAMSGTAYGAFREFCVAALRPIEGARAGTGIDALIQRAIETKQSLTNKNVHQRR